MNKSLEQFAGEQAEEAEQQEEFKQERSNEEVAAELMQKLNEKAQEMGSSINEILENPKLVDVIVGPSSGFNPLERVTLLGMIATKNRSAENYGGHSIQHFRGETDDHKAWRRSINTLRDYAVRPASTSRDREELKARNIVADQAHAVLVSLGGRQAVREPLSSEEITKLIQDMTARMLEWEILPPGEGEPPIEDLENEEDVRDRTRPDLDPERVKFLYHLLQEYKERLGGQYVDFCQSKLRGSSRRHPYYAVIIRKELSDKDYQEIAVAENPLQENAIYIAEDGDGLTWRDILREDKAGARELGARRKIHQADWKERVKQYLEEKLKA